MSKTGWIALAAVVIVAASISYLVYDNSAAGLGYVTGQAAGAFLIPGLIAFFVARKNKRPYRWDIVLGIVAVVLVSGNWKSLVDSYNFAQFRRDAQSAGSNVSAIQTSDSPFAGLMRQTIAIAADTIEKCDEIFVQLDDPVFDNIFGPPKVMDQATLDVAHKVALDKQRLLGGLIAQIDRLMSDEETKVSALFANSSTDVRSSVASGEANKHAALHAFYARRIAIEGNVLSALVRLTQFLSSNSGQYELADDKRSLKFASTALLGQYNVLITLLSETDADRQKLDEDVAAYQQQGQSNLNSVQ